MKFIDKKEIDKVIIGVDNFDNLKNIFQAIKKYKSKKNKIEKNFSFKINKKCY